MGAPAPPGGRSAGSPIPSAVRCGPASTHHVEHAGPARLIKEVEQDIERPLNAISEALPFVLIARGDERPVDEHGTSDDVLARHEAPVAGVEADVAIVAHGEDAARRHYQIAVLHVRGHGEPPFRRYVFVIADGHAGEIIAVPVVIALADDIRLIQAFSVAVHHAVLQMNPVARDTHDAFDDVETGLRWRDEDKDIAVTRLTIRNQLADPTGCWGQRHAVHEHVVPNEQGVLHRTRGNGEGLQREGNNCLLYTSPSPRDGLLSRMPS